MQLLHSHDVDVRRNVTALTAANLVSSDLTTWTSLGTMTNTVVATVNALFPAPFGIGTAGSRYADSGQITTPVVASDNAVNNAIRGATVSTDVGDDYVFSVFVKRSSSIPATAFQLEVRGTSGLPYAVGTFDIASDGVVTPRTTHLTADAAVATVGDVKIGVQAYGNSQYRCFIHFNVLGMGAAVTTLTPYIRIWDTVTGGQYRMLVSAPVLEKVTSAMYPRNFQGHPVVTAPNHSLENACLPTDYMVRCGGRVPLVHLPAPFTVQRGTESPNFTVQYDAGGDPGAVGTILFQGSNDGGTTWATIGSAVDLDAAPAGVIAVTTFYGLYRFTYGTGVGAQDTWSTNGSDASGGTILQRFRMNVYG